MEEICLFLAHVTFKTCSSQQFIARYTRNKFSGEPLTSCFCKQLVGAIPNSEQAGSFQSVAAVTAGAESVKIDMSLSQCFKEKGKGSSTSGA